MTYKINHIRILLTGWKRTRAGANDESIVTYIDALEAALVILGAMRESDTENAKRVAELEVMR